MARQLKVNPITCAAHGMCAELLPEIVALDDWGYPIITGDSVPPQLERLAKKAVDICPTMALKLVAAQAPRGPSVPRRPAQSRVR
jgi:ferredoxin